MLRNTKCRSELKVCVEEGEINTYRIENYSTTLLHMLPSSVQLTQSIDLSTNVRSDDSGILDTVDDKQPLTRHLLKNERSHHHYMHGHGRRYDLYHSQSIPTMTPTDGRSTSRGVFIRDIN
jgi:hypothetical protein